MNHSPQSVSLPALVCIGAILALPCAAQIAPWLLPKLAGYDLQNLKSEKLSAEESASIVATTKRLTVNRIKQFPNFFCEMTINRSRLRHRAGRPEWKNLIGQILVQVRHVNGYDKYRTIRIGRKRSKKPFFSIGKHGLKSGGEFGDLLANIQSMEFSYLALVVYRNRRVHVFSVRLPSHKAPQIEISGNLLRKVPWEGFVGVDQRSQQVVIIAIQTAHSPNYQIRKALQSVFFGKVNIDSMTYLMPLASESIVTQSRSPTYRQSSKYRNYRKFEVESELQYETVESTVSFPQ